MKLNSAAAPVEVVGNTSNSNFSIAVNGKAFRVLSDTLYKNKIGSIVREISCNAYDAHVMAGKKDTPFTIHLPDDFEPWFSVQDYGVGLSPDDIANVFTVYFQSTKDQSNDAIGAFGLGAKTPFSYTDQFTVTSVKDGMKRMYSAYITPEGIPNIAEMHAEETTEDNGVEIRIAVKREDYSKFSYEVSNQLRYFKVKPIVENVAIDFQQESAPLFEIEGFNVYNRNDYRRISSAIVILQGNVGYDLDWSNVRNLISAEARAFADRLASYKVVIEFEIGQIGVTASREGVEYDKTTIQNINDRLIDAQKKCTDFITEKINHLNTDFEKAQFIHSNGLYAVLSNHRFGNNFIVYGSGSTASIRFNNTVGGYFTSYTKSNTKLRRNYSGVVPAINIATLPRTAIVIKDMDTVGRLQQRIAYVTEDFGQSYLLVPNDDKTVEEVVENVVKLQGGYSDNIKFASKIVLPKTVRTGYKPSTFYRIGFSDTSLRCWKKVDNISIEEIDAETLYTTSFGMDFEDISSINEYRALKTIDPSIPELICIKKNDTPKAEENSNMIPVADYISEKRKEFKSKIDNGLRKKYIRSGFPSDVGNMIPYHLRKLNKDICNNAGNTDIAKVFEISNKDDPKELTKHEVNLCVFMGLDSEKEKFSEKRQQRLEKIASKFHKKYPLLEKLTNYGYYSDEGFNKAIVNYIKVFHEHSKTK